MQHLTGDIVRRFACALIAVVATATSPALLAAPEVIVEPMVFWRTFFARPRAVVSPTINPTTPAKITLGKMLFNDARLSGDGSRSCATCHQRQAGFSDRGAAAGRKIDGVASRDTPTLWNIGWAQRLFWDGRAATLEAQAVQPIGAAHELAGNWSDILTRLNSDNKILEKFATAFPETPPPSVETTVSALAAYQRSLVSPITRFDRWIEGDVDALSKEERDGFFLFVGRAGCVGCHAGWRFTDDARYDIGLPARISAGDITKPLRMKTPTLRMLTQSAPYMHNASFATLDEIVAHYISGGVNRRGVSEKMPHGLMLSKTERASLLAFLLSLSP